MDNPASGELDRIETIIRLLELTQRYGVTTGAKVHRVLTASEEHLRDTGHWLSFGCCREPEQSA